MIRIIVLLVLLAGVAGAAAWFADNPGTVVLEWRGYHVDTSVGVLVAAVALVAAATALIYRVWLFLRRAPRRISQFRQDSHRARGYKALSAGMVAVAAGDAVEARRQVRRAEGLLIDPPLTMLLAAQAAQLAGDEQAATRFFSAMLENPEMAFLGLRGLLNQALHRNDRPEALQLARKAYRLQPKSERVATNLFDLQAASGQWQDAEITLDEVAKAKLVGAETARRGRAVLAYMRAEGDQSDGNAKSALIQLRKSHDLEPSFVPGAVRLARVFLADGKLKQARQVVEKTWALSPHPQLFAAYQDVRRTSDKLQAVKHAEALSSINPAHLESHMVIAEAALDAGLWGEARRHLEAAGGGDPSARICRYLARLEEDEHGDEEKVRAWLVRAIRANPDPVWCCATCGNVAAAWGAVCSRCDSFDSFEWRAPAHVVALAAPEDIDEDANVVETHSIRSS